jgi:hypothetical protein
VLSLSYANLRHVTASIFPRLAADLPLSVIVHSIQRKNLFGIDVPEGPSLKHSGNDGGRRVARSADAAKRRIRGLRLSELDA